MQKESCTVIKLGFVSETPKSWFVKQGDREIELLKEGVFLLDTKADVYQFAIPDSVFKKHNLNYFAQATRR